MHFGEHHLHDGLLPCYYGHVQTQATLVRAMFTSPTSKGALVEIFPAGPFQSSLLNLVVDGLLFLFATSGVAGLSMASSLLIGILTFLKRGPNRSNDCKWSILICLQVRKRDFPTVIRGRALPFARLSEELPSSCRLQLFTWQRFHQFATIDSRLFVRSSLELGYFFFLPKNSWANYHKH